MMMMRILLNEIVNIIWEKTHKKKKKKTTIIASVLECCLKVYKYMLYIISIYWKKRFVKKKETTDAKKGIIL